MAGVVVAVRRLLPDADPAAVWALVADPGRVRVWAPAQTAAFMGTELPGVGHSVFVQTKRGAEPADQWRCRIATWEAGHRYVCELDGPVQATEQRLEVVVTADAEEGRPAARVELRYSAEAPGLWAPWYRWRAATLIRRAVEAIDGAVDRG